MGSHSKTYRATAAPSVGTNWKDAANIYDGDVNSYAERYATGTSATHINGFGINLPSYAVVNSVEVHSKLYSANSDGYIYVFLLSDLQTSDTAYRINTTEVVNGASLSAQYVTQTYTGSQLQTKLNEIGLHNGNVVEFLKKLRVRYVMGDAGDSILFTGRCRVYDNYVVVNYTIPDITYTYLDYDGTELKKQTVEQGTSPTPPRNPTRPSTAEYTYTFSGWSLSGTTYTAQYTATKRKYLIRVLISPEEAGYALANSLECEYGTEVPLFVNAYRGYKFVRWEDGSYGEVIDAGIKRTVTVTGAKDYTAYFEPVYVTFDSIFSFNKWKTNGITGSNGVVSDITDIGFTLTSNSGVSEGTASSPYFPVEAGKSYKIDIDAAGDGWDVYIFFHSETSTGTGLEFSDGTNRFSSNGSGNATRIFTAPEGAVKAQIRVDANGSNNEVSFSNFRIFPSGCDYMSTTVAAEDRSNAVSWNIPIPTRDGYEFLGWNTEADGSGTAYTSEGTFPTDDLTLYSQWKVIALPEFSIVQITPNPCDAGQGFIISVAFTE